MKELHDIARHDFVMWRSAGKPRFIVIFCFSMNQSRLRFKSALKYVSKNETIMRANALAESMMNNDMNGFWKDVHTITNSKVHLAIKVEGCVGDLKIAEMWKCQCKSLLNSVQKKIVNVNKQIKNSITTTYFVILDVCNTINVIHLVALLTFPQDTLFLLIVVYMFYYHCYSQLSLLMITCPVCL